jgi:hypothetical protein
MYRCVFALAVAGVVIGAPFSAAAQVARNFPQNALKGEVIMGHPPELLLNGKPARLAPGARIRGADNMLVMSQTMSGKRYTTLYTLDTLGLVKDVWLLRADELKRRWPKTATEAGRLRFDPIAQTWTKP